MKTEQDFKVSAMTILGGLAAPMIKDNLEWLAHELYENYKLGYEEGVNVVVL